ncbi:MAG TPA: Flp pilus assembly protein CpaB [Candidatus Acidoferrales bacterium]|nr:Flp pilus assembly protein CpaB [Candidatus Acidoferrales bacterium]
MRRPIVFVVLAGLGAVLAAIVVFSALRKRESEVQRAMAHTVSVVVAAETIPVGTKLQPSAVKLMRWSREAVPAGSFSDPQAVSGAYARSQFVLNEPIVTSKLFLGEKTSGVMPLLIPAGMRAMSVPVDEVGDIAGFVQPHTHVDVLVAVSGTGPDSSSFSRMVLQNIEVLAVAQEIEHVNDTPIVVRVITLLVSPADAEKLTLAGREGTLRLAMRNYGDAKIVATSGIAMGDLMHNGAPALPVMSVQPDATAGSPRAAPAHRSTPAAVPFRIEIMRDGKSLEDLSFVKSARVRRDGDRSYANAPASTPPPAAPEAEPPPDLGRLPAASDARAASLAASPAISFPAAPAPQNARAALNSTAEPKPGDRGYKPEPKVYLVP